MECERERLVSILFRLKEWLTVSEAAKHLSGIFEEDVTEADVLRLALDRRLKLSVNFVNHTRARSGKVVSWEETEWKLFPALPGIFDADKENTSLNVANIPPKLEALYNQIPIEKRGEYVPLMRGLSIDDKRFLEFDEKITTLTGIWDLPMIGNEKLDVEHEYQRLTNGPTVTLCGLDGSFVEGLNGQICQLQEDWGNGSQQEKKLAEGKDYNDPARYFPAGGLPSDAVLVIRTATLRQFEQLVTEKPTVTVSDNTLVATIAALLASFPKGKQPSGKDLERAASSVGVSVSDDSIRKALNLARDLAPSLKPA
jgi:hypothetical protein